MCSATYFSRFLGRYFKGAIKLAGTKIREGLPLDLGIHDGTGGRGAWPLVVRIWLSLNSHDCLVLPMWFFASCFLIYSTNCFLIFILILSSCCFNKLPGLCDRLLGRHTKKVKDFGVFLKFKSTAFHSSFGCRKHAIHVGWSSQLPSCTFLVTIFVRPLHSNSLVNIGPWCFSLQSLGELHWIDTTYNIQYAIQQWFLSARVVLCYFSKFLWCHATFAFRGHLRCLQVPQKLPLPRLWVFRRTTWRFSNLERIS